MEVLKDGLKLFEQLCYNAVRIRRIDISHPPPADGKTSPPVWLLVPASLTTSLRSFILHWLPVPQWIQFKVALTRLLVTVSADGPAYFEDVYTFHWPTGQTSVRLKVDT